MGIYALLAIGGGAALGAWLRWGLSLLFNPLFPTLPLGTLIANLFGGYLMGLAMEFLTQHASLPIELRLAATTGFLGGLTTFSTFSAETVTTFARQEYGWGIVIIFAHVVGSLVLTTLGIFTVRLLFKQGAL